MLLYGDEWGLKANVNAEGLANAKVVRKLTIYAGTRNKKKIARFDYSLEQMMFWSSNTFKTLWVPISTPMKCEKKMAPKIFFSPAHMWV